MNMFETNIKAIKPYIMNLDRECDLDMQKGKGIRLTSVDSFERKSKKKNGKEVHAKNEKIYNGLQSEFFGTDFGDNLAFNERFSCKCKKYVGMMYNGKQCEKCGSIVGFQEVDLKKFGWIIFDHFYVMNPICYEKLLQLLGSSNGEPVLNKILNVRYESEEDKVEPDEIEKRELELHPFMYKGMTWLHDHIDEVLAYYKKKKSTKRRKFEELEENISEIFCHCIPVYSAVMRSEVHGERGGKLFKLRVNTLWGAITNLSNFVNKFDEEEIKQLRIQISIDKALYEVMENLHSLFETDIKEMDSKNGMIATKVTGGRYNFSSRNIVICSSGRLKSDEVEIGYITFAELFRYEIQNLYTKLTGESPEKANEVWLKGLLQYNDTLYKIMQHMVEDPETADLCNIFISRNPMINYGSGIQMKVVRVKDFSDKTMTIPSNICGATNGDFDGDMFNIYRLFGIDMAKRWKKNLNPRYNLYVSRMTNNVNMEAIPLKNEWVGFYAFCNL